MGPRRLRFAAGFVAAILVTACTNQPAGTAAEVARIVAAAGGGVASQLVLEPAGGVQVQVRTPTGEQWWDTTGQLDQSPEGRLLPLGASRPDAFDYAALAEQLSAAETLCTEEPRVGVFVSVNGDTVAETSCGVGPNQQVLATTINGHDAGESNLDFLSEQGLTQFLQEAGAMVPSGIAYQVTLPGLASARGNTAKAEGGRWTLGDGTGCTVTYERAGRAPAGEPIRWFGCQGYGSQSFEGNSQDPFEPAALDAAAVFAAIKEVQRVSGFEPDEVAFYRIDKLLIGGGQVSIITADGRGAVVDLEMPD